jgi:hypothetical protein
VTARRARGVSPGIKALLVIGAVVVVAALAAAVEPARACSCIPPDPWTFLKQADGAFVGRLTGREDIGEGRARLTFSVERAVKGQIGASVDVVTANNGAACGIETSVGQRIGLFVAREDGHWTGTLCWQVSPEDLLAAAVLPAPDGRGPVAMFVGGRFGPARTLALDAKGRTLAYGTGRGYTEPLAPCPDGERLAEIARVRTGSELAIRETRTLRVIRRQALKLPGRRYPVEMVCEGGAGSSVVIFGIGAGDSPVGAGLYRLAGDRLSIIWEGTAYLSSLNPRVAYLNAGKHAARLVKVDLRTGRVTRIAWLPRSPSLVPDAAGKRLAGVAYLSGERSRVVVVDLTTRPVSIRSLPLGAPEVAGFVFWLSEARFVFLPWATQGTARVLDLTLRTRSQFRWNGFEAALAGSIVFGIDRRGRLASARLPAGPQRVVRGFPGEPQAIVSATR